MDDRGKRQAFILRNRMAYEKEEENSLSSQKPQMIRILTQIHFRFSVLSSRDSPNEKVHDQNFNFKLCVFLPYCNSLY
jgi:hypothetical protein